MRATGIANSVLSILFLVLAVHAASGSELIIGTATFRERIAVPPEAVFEAMLENVSRADALAEVIGQVRIDSPGNPPIRFQIPYDVTRIETNHTYSVRARIVLDGRLMFVTDKVYPVLTRGAGSSAEILLNRTSGPVPRVSRESVGSTTPETALAAHGLRLPATFHGDLPCADCEAIRHHLDLWPDQVFHLRREWVGRNLVRDEVGRWWMDPSRRALVLYEGGDNSLQFEIMGRDRLRLLDQAGEPIVSNLPYELVSDGTLTPVDLNLLLAGEMTYMADAARFTECLTGRSYPVAQEGDFMKMQRGYLAAVGKPGAKLYVTFGGSITDRPNMEGRGTERAVVVRRFINAWPNETCERAQADVSLTNTYWRVVRFGDEPVQAVSGRREPHLILRKGDGRQTVVATVGCNQLTGGYEVVGETLTFTDLAATKMACPPPLDDLEKNLADALAKTKRWRIKGPTLELSDEAGAVVALFEAVYL